MSAISELSTVHRVKAKTPEEKRLRAKEAARDNTAGYLFLLPWLIGLVLIVLVMANTRKDSIPKGLWAGLLVLAVAEVCVAVLWSPVHS